jgi:hypothetical protein
MERKDFVTVRRIQEGKKMVENVVFRDVTYERPQNENMTFFFKKKMKIDFE